MKSNFFILAGSDQTDPIREPNYWLKYGIIF